MQSQRCVAAGLRAQHKANAAPRRRTVKRGTAEWGTARWRARWSSPPGNGTALTSENGRTTLYPQHGVLGKVRRQCQWVGPRWRCTTSDCLRTVRCAKTQTRQVQLNDLNAPCSQRVSDPRLGATTTIPCQHTGVTDPSEPAEASLHLLPSSQRVSDPRLGATTTIPCQPHGGHRPPLSGKRSCSARPPRSTAPRSSSLTTTPRATLRLRRRETREPIVTPTWPSADRARPSGQSAAERQEM